MTPGEHPRLARFGVRVSLATGAVLTSSRPSRAAKEAWCQGGYALAAALSEVFRAGAANSLRCPSSAAAARSQAPVD